MWSWLLVLGITRALGAAAESATTVVVDAPTEGTSGSPSISSSPPRSPVFEEPADAARWRRIRSGTVWVGGGALVLTAVSGAGLFIADETGGSELAYFGSFGGLIAGGIGLGTATAFVGYAAFRGGQTLRAACPHHNIAGGIALASTAATATSVVLSPVFPELAVVALIGAPTIWISSAAQARQDRRALADCGGTSRGSWKVVPQLDQPGLRLVGQF